MGLVSGLEQLSPKCLFMFARMKVLLSGLQVQPWLKGVG